VKNRPTWAKKREMYTETKEKGHGCASAQYVTSPWHAIKLHGGVKENAVKQDVA